MPYDKTVEKEKAIIEAEVNSIMGAVCLVTLYVA